jgi:hypothetical protein
MGSNMEVVLGQVPQPDLGDSLISIAIFAGIGKAENMQLFLPECQLGEGHA